MTPLPKTARIAAGVPDSGTPAALLFDLGRTLLRLEPAVFEAAFARLGAQAAALAAFLEGGTCAAWNRGGLDGADFAAGLRRELGLAAGDGELREAWCALVGPPLPGMAALAGEALRAGLPVALFSNTDPWHWARARESLPLLDEFAGRALSFELGALKPDDAAFAAMEAALGRPAGGYLFVDDREENLAAARRRGHEALRHEPDRPGPEPALAARVRQLLEDR